MVSMEIDCNPYRLTKNVRFAFFFYGWPKNLWLNNVFEKSVIIGEKGWHSGKRTRLPPMRPWFDSGLVPDVSRVWWFLGPRDFSCEIAQFAEFFEIHQEELHHKPSFSLTALAISLSCLRPLSINILS